MTTHDEARALVRGLHEFASGGAAPASQASIDKRKQFLLEYIEQARAASTAPKEACKFCHGVRRVRTRYGEERCPECRGTGDEAQVNDHLRVTIECLHCGETTREFSCQTSVHLRLDALAEAHLACKTDKNAPRNKGAT